MHKLAELCVKRPVFASVLILSLVVVGLFSYRLLGVDRFPNVDFPFVTISTRLVGAAPEEIETEITDKIEEAVNTISGIDQLISISSEGNSVVTVQFVLEKDGDVAAQEVRDRVNTILGQLPTDADPPIIEKIDPDASPVLSIVLSGPAPIRDITEFADKTLRRQIESVLGVGQVRIVGGRPRQINVVVDTSRLAGLQLTAAEVVQALQTQNVQLPGGKVEQGARDLTLRTYGRVSQPSEFALIPVAVRNGRPVRVGDVARVEDGMAEPDTVATFAGEPAVVLQVRKQSGTNTIAVVDLLKERIDELRGQLPPGWKMDLVRDQSEYIIAAVDAVQEHLILGSIFAAAIVWLFLGKLRPTLISAVAIPSALIATFAAMEWMGFTLNVITLLALTLAVGIVIDDAVIVLEIIFRYMEEKKMSAREAAIEGTREVGLAVIAMTLSLIAVFLPVAFMAGIVGRFMNSFGVTMAFAIAVSLLVAFTLTPMMSSRWLRESDMGHGKSSRESRFYAPVEGAYMAILSWSMRRRWAVVTVMVLVFASTVPLLRVANKNFLPSDDESQFEVIVRAPEGSSLETTRVIMESIATRVRALPGVAATLLTIGDDQQRTRNLGTIYVKLTRVSEREESQFDIMARVRSEVLPQYSSLALRAQVAPVSPFRAGQNSEIMFWVGGPDLDRLAEYASRLMEVLRSQPGVADPDTNLVVGNPELGVRIDRAKAADLGVQVQDIAATMNVLVGGLEVTDYYEGGEQYEVHVRADERYRRDASGIVQAEVPSRKAARVALKDVISTEEGTGPSLINRISRRRQVLLYCNMAPGHSSQAVIDALERTAAELNMPGDYSYGLTGRSREQGRAFTNFLIAFVLSIIFMYLILAAQFESWLHPVTILLALPLTVPFAVLSIVIFNQSINIFSLLGILVLFGIVKKNGILQIDRMNGLRDSGMARDGAILAANRDRLRPILMTTLAFVAGMIPLVVSSGTGAGTNRAIGTVVIGGQTLALLLTLVGTPVAYSIFDDWSQAKVLARLRGWLSFPWRRSSREPSEAQAASRSSRLA
jgi:HAE1 family hydrophobic/amphiphilic exporter-1